MERENKPNKIIIHHTASPRDTTTVDQIEDWHMRREFTKSKTWYHIGYHFVILGGGKLITTRYENEEGCHTLGQNTQSIGIALTGNFNTEKPSTLQMLTLGRLLDELMKKYKIPLENILPHRLFGNTSCFGAELPESWGRQCWLLWKIDRLLEEVEKLKQQLN